MKNSVHLLLYSKNPVNRLCIFMPIFHSNFKIKISYIEG
jgi:hypothetical protein